MVRQGQLLFLCTDIYIYLIYGQNILIVFTICGAEIHTDSRINFSQNIYPCDGNNLAQVNH